MVHQLLTLVLCVLFLALVVVGLARREYRDGSGFFAHVMIGLAVLRYFGLL